MQQIDNQRDQFRRYVESHGVVDMFTKVLIQLMRVQDKPENPIEFIREQMGASLKEKQHIEILKQEVEFYRQKVDELTKQLDEAKLQGGNVQVSVVDSQSGVEATKPTEAVVEQKESVVLEAKVSSPLPVADVVVEPTKEVALEVEEVKAVTEAIVVDASEIKEAEPSPVVTAKPSAAEIPEVVKPTASVEPTATETIAPKVTESEEKIAEIITAATAAN